MVRITRSGTKLKQGTADYIFAGADLYDGLDSSPAEAGTRLKEIHDRGGNCVRVWFYSKSGKLDDSGGLTFFQRLDQFLAAAAALNMTVIATLSNWNEDWGGPSSWGRDQTTWFDSIQQDWWAQVVSLINHVNAGDYADTILFWEIQNEPRPDNTPARMAWIGNVAQQIKQLDPNHLLSPGAESFVHNPPVYPYSNPNDPSDHSESGASADLDIIPVSPAIGASASQYIDVVSVHFYSKYLTIDYRPDKARQDAAIAAMKAAADQLGKPMFFGEIGYDPRDYDMSTAGRQIYSDSSYVPTPDAFKAAAGFMHDVAVKLHDVGAAGGLLWAWGRAPAYSFTLAAGDSYSDAVMRDWTATLLAAPAGGGTTPPPTSGGGTSPTPGTVAVRVTSAADDAYHAFKPQGHVYSFTANDVAAGLFSKTETALAAAMRFPAVQIPQGATITSAKLTLVSSGDDSTGTVRSKIRGLLADNGKMPADYKTFHTVPFTKAIVAWDNIGAWASGQAYDSPELKSIIQEIVNRPRWRSGNAIVLRWGDLEQRSTQVAGAVRRGRSFNNDPVNAPLLTITWTTS